MSAVDTLTAKELGVPSLPPGSPAHLEHMLDELNESLDLDAPGTSLRVLKRTLQFLAGYYADLVQGVASVFGELTFNHKEGAPDPAEFVEAIQTGMGFLVADAPQELPEVRSLVDVFYEDGAGKKFARILGVGGKPRRGTMPLERFIAAPIPVRKKCVQEVRRYLPYLREWLESSANLFSNAAIASERTSQEGKQTIVVQLGKQTVTTGKRLEVASCALCIPEREIDVPNSLYERPVYFFVPQKAPVHLSEILTRLDEAMKKEDPVSGFLELRNALEFLIRYFAGVASKVCEDLEALPKSTEQLIDNSQSLSASERLLNTCLEVLRLKPDSLAAKTVIGIFYRRNEMFEFVPRWHAEILALNGQLSGWCQLEPGYGELEDPEVCKLEFEKHVPTLREWLVALGGYLQSTEHFFNEVKPEGNVEFSLRIGDRFIEIGEPGYTLWLNNPRPAGEAVEIESGLANKPLIRESIPIPKGTPGVLERILTRMDLYLRLGEPIESCISLRDALDYLTRYFAGIALAAFRELGTLPAEAEKLAEQSLSIYDCEKLLILALRSIGHESDEKLGIAVKNVFYYVEEFSKSEKPTGAHARLLALDADPSSKMQNLAEFCSLKAGEGVLSHPARSKRELERFLPTLQDWLAMAEPFFRETKHHEEPPESDGKTELVVEYGDFYLELVEPEYTFYIRPGADEVPDIEAPELPPDLAFDEDLVDEPIRRKSPEEAAHERPFLVHRVDLIGERENSTGKKCQAGYIVLTNAGGGTLSGTATTTDPCLQVDPPRFRGNKVALSYWVDTDELPDTHEVFIQLKTAHEQRDISVFEMIGQARTRPVSATAGTIRMLMPALVSIAIFFGAFYGVSYYIVSHLQANVGRYFATMQLTRDAPEALSDVLFLTHLLGYFFLFTAGIVPVLVAKVFRRFPPSAQELLQNRRRLFMLLPSAVIGLGIISPLLSNELTGDPDFPSMDLYGMYLIFLVLNFASTYYQELALTEKLDDMFLNPAVRTSIDVAAWFLFLTAILMGVSG
ncbi:MAG: hypothetical protein WC314_00455 [Vulcanimicrobiota bacterium]